MEAKRRSLMNTSPLGSTSRPGSRSTQREQLLSHAYRKRKERSEDEVEGQGD